MLRAPNRLSWIAAFLIGTATPASAGVELVSRVHPRYVSDTGTGGSEVSSISADGRYVAFVSEAPNLVPGQEDQNYGPDVFVYDRTTGATELISRIPGSETTTGDVMSFDATISADGRFVAFTSFAFDLVEGQDESNEYTDVFLHDRATGRTELVSHTSSSRTATSLEGAWDPVISADGRYIAFSSDSADLIEGGDPDSSILGNVFLYDRVTGKVELASRSRGSATLPGNDTSYVPAISANGRYVAFLSFATDLVAGQRDTNGERDVFLYDRTAKTVTLVSHTSSSPTTTANGVGFRRPAISADGGIVVFDSVATNLVAGQTGRAGLSNVFLFQRATGQIRLVSHASSSPTLAGDRGGGTFALSADGGFVAFTSSSNDLVPRQAEGSRRTSDVFLYSRADGRITLVSGAGGSSTAVANGSSAVRGVSADASRILLQSTATNLARGVADANKTTDIFLYDRRSGRASLVSHGAASATTAANAESLGSILSADGRWVVFASAATDLESGVKDFNDSPDVVLDGGAAGRELLSRRAPEMPSDTSQAPSIAGSISADGRFVVFGSDSSWLVSGQRDTNHAGDLFVRDRKLGKTLLVSRKAGAPNTTGNAGSTLESTDFGPPPVASLSADGRFIVFLSFATDLVSGPGTPPVPDEVPELFLFDRETGGMSRLGSLGAFSRYALSTPAISADGSFVAFMGTASRLVPGQIDGNSESDVFLYDRAAGTVTLVSRIPGSAATAGDGVSVEPALSADGRFVVFTSLATNLVPGQSDAEGTPDVFLYDRVTGTTTLVSRKAASPGSAAGGAYPTLSADGRFVSFTSSGTDLVPGQVDSPGSSDVFLYDRLSGTTTLVTHKPGSAVTATGGFSGPLSADGRFAVFTSRSSELVAGQDGHGSISVFLFDRETGAVTLVSRKAGSATTTANGSSQSPGISADGRWISFESDAWDLLPGNTGSFQAVFLYDRITGAMVLASPDHRDATRAAWGFSSGPLLSADGSAVAFTSEAPDLVPRDFNVSPGLTEYYFSHSDAFVYSRR